MNSQLSSESIFILEKCEQCIQKNGDWQILHVIGAKMNREDVIALRWPTACLSCGIDVPLDVHPRYAIVGLFHEEKNIQVLLKLPGFFYICAKCSSEINYAVNTSRDNSLSCERDATQLLESPWNEFIELDKRGFLKLPEGTFREKASKINPEISFGTIPCPLTKLKKRISQENGGF